MSNRFERNYNDRRGGSSSRGRDGYRRNDDRRDYRRDDGRRGGGGGYLESSVNHYGHDSREISRNGERRGSSGGGYYRDTVRGGGGGGGGHHRRNAPNSVGEYYIGGQHGGGGSEHYGRDGGRGGDVGYDNRRGREHFRDDGYNRGGGRGGGGEYDRSRSRDHRRRGGGGRGFGGRGGGRGGRVRPKTMIVLTNHYKLEMKGTPEIYQYEVDIRRGRKLVERDENGKVLRNEIIVDPKKKDEIINAERSGPHFRRIVRKLITDEQFPILPHFDDGRTLVSPIPLFDCSESDSKMYQVRSVLKDCDETEVDAALIQQKSHFMVQLKLVAILNYAMIDQYRENFQKDTEYKQKIRQALAIVLKSAMLWVGMKSFGRNPRTFYFPEDMQREVINSQRLQNMLANEKDFMPLLGLHQAVRFCEGGNFFVNTDTVVDFANREFQNLMNTKVPVPLLDGRRSTICGIRVNLHDYIRDFDIKAKIEAALKKIKINAKYIVTPTAEFVNKMREKGLNEEQIKSRNIKVRRNKIMKEDMQRNKQSIIWGADDPALYSFTERRRKGDDETKPLKEYTIVSYFKERYRIDIKYPKMPIVFLGDKEWFPIEFLFQSFGKMKAANSDRQVNAVLDYYNTNAGTKYVENVTQLATESLEHLRQLGFGVGKLDDILAQYNFRKSSDPVELEAKLLPEPKLRFGDNADVWIKDGDFDIMNGRRPKQFVQASNLNSFAVLNCAGNGSCVGEFMKTFLHAAKGHGMSIPDVNVDQALYALISDCGANVREIERGFYEALEKALNFFVYDANQAFRSKNVWFRTKVKRQGLYKTYVNSDDHFLQCLVIPFQDQSKKAVGLILEEHIAFPTHRIRLGDGVECDARLMVKIRGTNDLVDPFAFRYDHNQNCHLVYSEGTGRWETAHYEGKFFKLKNGQAYPVESVQQSIPNYLLHGEEITMHLECISMVFVILPEKIAEMYGLPKLLSHFKFGIPSQCIISPKFKSQRNDRFKDQFCSNVAIKVNAKLSSASNSAQAWQTYYDNVKGIPWIRDVPTFVMGISISNTLGQHAVSVISGSVCLDSSCMRMAQDVKIQSKIEEVIDGSILEDLTRALLLQYYLDQKQMPERMLIYRDGVSDGSFGRVQAQEIQHIRNAFLQFKHDLKGSSSNEKASLYNTVPITFVVCHTKNNLKIVPKNADPGVTNVWSGTVLDKVITDFQTLKVTPLPDKDKSPPGQLIYTEPDGEGYDFVLVAHGGRMGTSKTVHYRVLLNENAVWRSPNGSPLTKPDLELLTWHMSFQYSTASKAIRIVPVVHYSSRLSNQVMGYVAYLRRAKALENKEMLMSGNLLLNSDDGENRDSPFMRCDKQNLDIPSFLKTIILPNFSAFPEASLNDQDQVHYDIQKYQLPFHTHIAA